MTSPHSIDPNRRAALLTLLWTGLAGGCGVGQDGTGAAPDSQATGVVTGFGSVIVDGVTYDIGGADIATDGTGGRRQDDLRVGMVVTLTGRVADDGASGSATRVIFDSLIRGALDAAPGANAFQVLGQRIGFDSATVFDGVDSAADLAGGDPVQVSGFIDPAGGFRATWVGRESSAPAPQLTGFLTAVNSAQVQLAGVIINITGAALVGFGAGSPSIGQRVRATLQAAPAGGAAVATRLALIDANLAGALRSLALHGLVRNWNASAQTFDLERQSVRLTAATQFFGGNLADIGNGARLRVVGPRGTDDVLNATRVHVYAPAIDGYVRGRVAAVDLANRRVTVQVTPAAQVLVQVQERTLLSDRTLASGALTLANLAINQEVLALGWLNGGTLDAGLLQRLPLLTPGVGVGGPVNAVNGTGLTILGVAVVPANTAQYFDAQGGPILQAAFYAGLLGALVRVEGAQVGNSLVATVLRRVA